MVCEKLLETIRYRPPLFSSLNLMDTGIYMLINVKVINPSTQTSNKHNV